MPELQIPREYTSLPALRRAHVALVAATRRAGAPEQEVVDRFLQAAARTGLVLHDEPEREVAQRVVDYWVTTCIREDWDPPVETLAEFDLAKAPELPESACPYVGLAAFDERDAERFFGRESEIAELLRRHGEDGQRLLAVLGPSGSGKSSLVYAGVLPRLSKRCADAGEELRVHRMVPTNRPLQALAEALGSRNTVQDALAFVSSTEQAVHLARVETGPTLLIVDQFEELFTLCPVADKQRAFARALLDLTTDAQARTTVLLTLRSDYEERLAALPDLHAAARQGLLRLPPLSAAELRTAVERPAGDVGLHFEAGVVDRLIEEVQGEFAALPLLQFTLRALWELRTRNLITMAAFDRVGGARRALETRAEAVFGALIPEEQHCARRLFGRLVQSGQGHEFTRRRALRSELRGLEDPGRVDRVIDRFADARLLSMRDVTRDAVVEITHEALLRNWPRLVGWLEDSRHALRVHAQLRDAVQRWREGGEHDHDLLSPGRIAQFAELSGIESDEKDFIERSRALWKAQRRRKARRIQALIAVLLLAVGISGVGWWQALEARGRAEESANVAQTHLARARDAKAKADVARKKAETAEGEARKQQAQADALRKKADRSAIELKRTNDELEIVQSKLRRELAGSHDRQLDALEDVLGLVEMALPDLSVLASTREGDDTRDEGRFKDARADVKKVKALAQRARKRFDAVERAVKSPQRRRDKEARERMGLVRKRVEAMHKRLDWFDEQVKVREAQVDAAQKRFEEARRRRAELLQQKKRVAKVLKRVRPLRSAMTRLAMKNTPEDDKAVWAKWEELKAAYTQGLERSVAMNAIALSWYGARRYKEADRCFRAAAALAGRYPERRARYVLNRAWAKYRQAMTLRDARRSVLLLQADKLARTIEKDHPGASTLRKRIHATKTQQQQRQVQQQIRTINAKRVEKGKR